MTKLDLAQQITQTFINRINEMSPQVQAHFITRLYRVTGKEEYKNWVLTNIPVKVARIKTILSVAKDDDKILEYSKVELSKFKILKENDIKKRQLMDQYPQVYFYDDLLAGLAYLKGIGYKMQELNIERLIPQIKQYCDVLLNPEILRFVTVRDINAIYWIKDLFGIDKAYELIQNFKNVFDESVDANLSYTNLIYGYTHIIISSSLYYQLFVQDENLNWIKEELIKNIDKILNKCSADIIAEVGLTLKLMKYYDEGIFDKITQKIFSSFDEKAGLIPYPGVEKPLGTLEHRNIIAIMFLTDFNNLYIF